MIQSKSRKVPTWALLAAAVIGAGYYGGYQIAAAFLILIGGWSFITAAQSATASGEI